MRAVSFHGCIMALFSVEYCMLYDSNINEISLTSLRVLLVHVSDVKSTTNIKLRLEREMPVPSNLRGLPFVQSWPMVSCGP